MKKIRFLFIAYAIICGLVVLPSACTSDKLPEPVVTIDCSTENPTYDTQIKPIIDQSCAISGCHEPNGGGPGSYTNYAGMANFLNDNEFKKFVIELKDDPDRGMPPNWSSNPGPKNLTPEQFALVQCWVEAGYPEN